MNAKFLYKYRLNNKNPLNMTDFYAIETPPSSSSTSKDSLDESISSFNSKKRMKLISTNLGQISNQSKSIAIKTDEVRFRILIIY
jgi:hypothetical protein